MTTPYTYGGTFKLDLDKQLDNALARMNGDVSAAAQLFLRWCESNSEIADLLPPLVEEYVKQRIAEHAKEIVK